MNLFLYLVISFVDLLISVIIFAMLIRSVMSMFMANEDNRLYILACAVTEPFLYPMRALFEKHGWFQGLPIDASFFCTAMLLLLVQTVLSALPIG